MTAPAALMPLTDAERLDLNALFEAYGPFVWRSLQRLGVRDGDLDDQLQEVFVVIHRRLGDYDPSRPVQAWLFGICIKVAAAHRRRAYVRRERPVAEIPEPAGPAAATPEDALVARQRQDELARVLDALDLEKRAIFVMFEIDEMSCNAIADELGIPVGTVYSRLHAARAAFAKAARRHRAEQRVRTEQDERGPSRSGGRP